VLDLPVVEQLEGYVAQIVLGIGTSHTPQMTMDPGLWEDHARRDLRNLSLIGRDGEVHRYEELAKEATPSVLCQLDLEVYREKHERAQSGLNILELSLRATRPDVVIVVGDDQNELFGPEGIPAVGIFTGGIARDLPISDEHLARLSEGMRQSHWASHSKSGYEHRVHAGLAEHLTAQLALHDFDVTRIKHQPTGRSIGHAFNFVRYRLRLDEEIPFIPVLLNTYIPPNVLSPSRCYRLGQAIKNAVDCFDQDLRVAVVGSGGLSHFVVLEEFDREVLRAVGEHDTDAIARLSRSFFRSGTSEVLNWITAGGSLEHLQMRVIDYIPGYRSPAGTGTGMAFAIWE